MGADPVLEKQYLRIYLTSCICCCGMICLWCSHLTGLRLGGISPTFRLFCVGSHLYRCYFLLNNLHIMHPSIQIAPPRNPPPLGALGSLALQHKSASCICPWKTWGSKLKSLAPAASRSQDPPLPYICEDVNTTSICAHARSHAGTCGSNASELRDLQTQTHVQMKACTRSNQ